MLGGTLKNKKIIISAGASGIGWAITKVCVAKGASIYLCDVDPKAINKVILPSDGFDLSTKEFIEIIGIINGKKPFIFSVYPWIIDLFLKLIGKKKMSESLLCDLQVDSQYLFDDLGWAPVFNVKTQLNKKEY